VTKCSASGPVRARSHGRERDCILAALRPILPHRGEAHPARPAQPDSSSREPQSSAIAGAREREPPQEQTSSPHRARIRCSTELTRWPDRTTIGIARAKAKIGLQNLAYNIRRLVMVDRIAAAYGSSATGRRLGNPAAEQAQGPPINPVEMGLPDIAFAVYRGSQRPYRPLFEQVWGQQAFAIAWPSDVEQVCNRPAGRALLSIRLHSRSRAMRLLPR
jgi:hypothetical protein